VPLKCFDLRITGKLISLEFGGLGSSPKHVDASTPCDSDQPFREAVNIADVWQTLVKV
jgi:hypothetical protein